MILGEALCSVNSARPTVVRQIAIPAPSGEAATVRAMLTLGPWRRWSEVLSSGRVQGSLAAPHDHRWRMHRLIGMRRKPFVPDVRDIRSIATGACVEIDICATRGPRDEYSSV